MLIILFSFALLTTITTFAVKNYAYSATEEVVLCAVGSAQEYLEQQFAIYFEENAQNNNGSIYGYVSENKDTVASVMKYIAEHSDGITVLVTDNSGEVMLSVTSDGVVSDPEKIYIPQDIMQEFDSGTEIHSIRIEELFDAPQTASGMELKSPDGTKLGNVFVCASTATLSDLQDAIVTTTLMSSICVMIAALIAIYFITDKITGPLKDMRNAARSFAAGDFTIRVPVRGRDEVAELATAFNNMANSLESAEKMRNSFMANVSHDLRTPMTTIAGFIDGILDGAIPTEKQSHYLNIIAAEVKRLSRLVSQLLDISRIEAGDRKFNMQPFDACEMARQILISFEQKIDGKHLVVEFDSDSENMYANADRDAIYQIFYNIFENAVKFSKDGGELLIGINYTADREKIMVTVYNEGQGIKPDDLPYVFERFYKGDKSRGLDKTGVGLGMYITKTIIDAHNEKISVDSEYGKYCRFSFTLANVKENAQ